MNPNKYWLFLVLLQRQNQEKEWNNTQGNYSLSGFHSLKKIFIENPKTLSTPTAFPVLGAFSPAQLLARDGFIS